MSSKEADSLMKGRMSSKGKLEFSFSLLQLITMETNRKFHEGFSESRPEAKAKQNII